MRTHITAEPRRFQLNLKEVWQYRDLIFLFTKRYFVLNYKQTILGPLWIILNPLITSFFYMVVFGNIAKLSTDGVPQMLFYLTGNAFWNLFSTCIIKNADTFRANADVFGKVYFPRLTVSVSNVLCAMIHFVVQLGLVMIPLILYVVNGMVSPHWGLWFLIPLILVQLGLLGMGCGIIISSLTTKYRDLAILVTFAVNLWMYATPVVYPLSATEGWIRTVLLMNPVTAQAELFRYIVLGQGTVNLFHLGISLIVTLLIAVWGISVFNKVEKNFMDTI